MAKANINDRSSIERIYDRPSFERDAAANARSKATIVHGVKILSAPDADGQVEISRASHHVAEGNPEGDTIFIPAFSLHDSTAADGNIHVGSVAPVATPPGEAADEYRSFIDDVLNAAKQGHFKSEIGRGEERLKGFQGG
ncbi:hypothetical protein A6A40_18275 (plasmid) [Azospirillum humicireducens]|uniref:Uncharacterized protein n=1 Tax=Azospirillum humicireducens TaxID=1226968 RepID=A0A2R4VRF7_9PROT|nr:hypothetical protein [Azospirillum humicireducens]AWB07033.1 hypothetical protein A6A40_18275 [Azospirillum humicireducens]